MARNPKDHLFENGVEGHKERKGWMNKIKERIIGFWGRFRIWLPVSWEGLRLPFKFVLGPLLLLAFCFGETTKYILFKSPGRPSRTVMLFNLSGTGSPYEELARQIEAAAGKPNGL